MPLIRSPVPIRGVKSGPVSFAIRGGKITSGTPAAPPATSRKESLSAPLAATAAQKMLEDISTRIKSTSADTGSEPPGNGTKLSKVSEIGPEQQDAASLKNRRLLALDMGDPETLKGDSISTRGSPTVKTKKTLKKQSRFEKLHLSGITSGSGSAPALVSPTKAQARFDSLHQDFPISKNLHRTQSVQVGQSRKLSRHSSKETQPPLPFFHVTMVKDGHLKKRILKITPKAIKVMHPSYKKSELSVKLGDISSIVKNKQTLQLFKSSNCRVFNFRTAEAATHAEYIILKAKAALLLSS